MRTLSAALEAPELAASAMVNSTSQLQVEAAGAWSFLVGVQCRGVSWRAVVDLFHLGTIMEWMVGPGRW